MAVFSERSKLHDIQFGTDGWRALIAKEFTYKNLRIFLDGLAAYILENYGTDKPLVIGYDARFLADKFASFASDVINSWGIDTLCTDHPIPTPVIAFAASLKYKDSRNAADGASEVSTCGAITFTASHNPPEYMGIKYIPEYAGPASKAITDLILEQIELAAQGELIKSDKQGTKQIINPKEAYFEKIRTLVNFDAIKDANKKSPTKLVYDPLYGCGRGYTNKLLEEAGFQVETLHDFQDPTFGGSMPDPKESILKELKERIISSGASLGAANDGDSDRFAFMDEAGNFYPANKSLPIILKYLIEKRGYTGVVARTVATTHLLDEVAHKFNMQVIETAVGFKWLCEIMRREPTILCAEESGGMSILGHIPEKDGILATLLLAEILAISGKKLSELWDEVQELVGKKYFYDSLNLHLDGDAKQAFMNKFNDANLKEISGLKVMHVDKTEGVKIYLENGIWLLARPSGTEAMCRVYFEGNDKALLDKVVKAVGEMTNA